MRGDDRRQKAMFSYVTLEQRVPRDHPLRPIREMVDRALAEMSPEFEKLYSGVGRPSIAPERLLRGLLIQVLYTIRSERMLMEQLGYNLLFRWFVGLEMDDPVWVPTVFSKNRDRLLAGEIARSFFEKVLAQARERHLLSNEHFTVDGTLLEAWASQKSFRPKGQGDPKDGPPADRGNPSVNFRGERRTNETHQSRTDPEARLYRKGNNVGATLCYLGHALMENRNGLIVDARVSQATGTAEREMAYEMAANVPGGSAITMGADKAYDVRDFVGHLRAIGVTPHVAQNNTARSSAVDGRTTRHAGYRVSQRKRKLVEQAFGWIKTVGGMRKARHRGVARVEWMFTLTIAAYNLTRIRKLVWETG
ncbi:MAG: IS5 family transposase [Candidatus Eisenbacteria sp.]|nr:IS5 family transposase [Candidatus Eisenbacteria bacterium]